MRNVTGKGGFKKGQSGNPAGRKVEKYTAELRDMCRSKSVEWFQRLDDIIQNKFTDVPYSVQAACIRIGFEFGFGKPTQNIHVSEAPTEVRKMSLSELEEKVLSRRAGADGKKK